MAVSPKDFCAEVRNNPVARSQAGLERLALAIQRLLNVLETEKIAGIRTLEMKISDAGPLDQRIEPHILSLAGLELLQRNRIAAHRHSRTGSHKWYAPVRFSEEIYAEKLEDLAQDYLATTNPTFTSALGDPLEISICKILQQLKIADRRFTYQGSYDLSARAPNGRFPKIEPPSSFNGIQLNGPSDFVIFVPKCGETALIECKNHREWVYPSRAIMKETIAKALAAEMTPILVARRLPYITKHALCEPAGIIAHETYNQLYPETTQGRDLAERVQKPRGLGYFDVRASEEPLARSTDFFNRILPELLPIAAQKFRTAAPILKEWVNDRMTWRELRLRLAGSYDGPDHEMEF